MPGSFRSRQKKLAYIVLCTNNFFLKTLKTLNITVKLILIKQELFNLQNDDKLSNFSKSKISKSRMRFFSNIFLI